MYIPSVQYPLAVRISMTDATGKTNVQNAEWKELRCIIRNKKENERKERKEKKIAL